MTLPRTADDAVRAYAAALERVAAPGTSQRAIWDGVCAPGTCPICRRRTSRIYISGEAMDQCRPCGRVYPADEGRMWRGAPGRGRPPGGFDAAVVELVQLVWLFKTLGLWARRLYPAYVLSRHGYASLARHANRVYPWRTRRGAPSPFTAWEVRVLVRVSRRRVEARIAYARGEIMRFQAASG